MRSVQRQTSPTRDDIEGGSGWLWFRWGVLCGSGRRDNGQKRGYTRIHCEEIGCGDTSWLSDEMMFESSDLAKPR
eukprot:4653492-Pleurochrysis_carterae.AAC.1